MRELVIRPLAGQSIQLLYSGIHSGTLRLILADGTYVDFTDGEIFRDLRRPRQDPVLTRDDMKVYRISHRQSEAIYQLDGTGRRTEDYNPPRVLVSGTALSKRSSDFGLLDLLHFETPESADCDRRYAYGWGVILDGEPVKVDLPGNDREQEN
ncbi:hypothetical protein [Erythrobacter mangrovi]|uniref:Uncharacterized protein n=1 Tax=Erythrobacter mangrovi TaxID=2739433 RepID=A0A7D3XWY7_9SPHN|nr:hypothetical protein [Erythrobacter mangrovi]QKG72136.1 hypothetical protein HQR01_12595 [Erythrobacter mangrovi]